MMSKRDMNSLSEIKKLARNGMALFSMYQTIASCSSVVKIPFGATKQIALRL